MKQLTVRNVTPRLARMLDQEKKRRRKSLNQTVLELLQQALGLAPNSSYDNGLAKLSGTWTDEEHDAFEEATKSFGQIDQELWDK